MAIHEECTQGVKCNVSASFYAIHGARKGLWVTWFKGPEIMFKPTILNCSQLLWSLQDNLIMMSISQLSYSPRQSWNEYIKGWFHHLALLNILLLWDFSYLGHVVFLAVWWFHVGPFAEIIIVSIWCRLFYWTWTTSHHQNFFSILILSLNAHTRIEGENSHFTILDWEGETSLSAIHDCHHLALILVGSGLRGRVLHNSQSRQWGGDRVAVHWSSVCEGEKE